MSKSKGVLQFSSVVAFGYALLSLRLICFIAAAPLTSRLTHFHLRWAFNLSPSKGFGKNFAKIALGRPPEGLRNRRVFA